MAYNAVIAKLENVRKHSGADRLQVAQVLGYQVIVGMNVSEGDIGIAFPEGGQIESEFLLANNLYRKHPVTKEPGGFFDENGRVRALKLRGEISDCFWIPLSSLTYLGDKIDIALTVGTEFNTINGKEICKKYLNAATIKAMKAAEKAYKKPAWLPSFLVPWHKSRSINKAKYDACPDFKKHFDTPQLRVHHRNIEAMGNTYLVWTSKLHGCVSKDTLIDTLEYGSITIGEVVDKKLDVSILGMDVTTGQVKYSPISSHYFLADSGEWYEIETEDGRKVQITGNNPVWLENIKAYRPADKLKVGDILTIAECPVNNP